jgi:hypothetical protein
MKAVGKFSSAPVIVAAVLVLALSSACTSRRASGATAAACRRPAVPSAAALRVTAPKDTKDSSGDTEPATGTDDGGHRGGETDAVWAKEDPSLRVSFGYTSEHALAQAARAIITAYYGSPSHYSFFDGCSDGGREALVEAQRYPKDFDGILAGSPANIEAQLLGTVAPWVIDVNTGAHGREILTSEKLPALHAVVVKACGTMDRVSRSIRDKQARAIAGPGLWDTGSYGPTSSGACQTLLEPC